MGTRIEQTDLARDALYTKVNQIADEKQDVLTFDDSPTAASDNPVKSEGVKSALDSKVSLTGAETIAGVKTFSDSPQVPTPTSGDSSRNVANTEFVTNVSSSLQTQINTKANSSSVVNLTDNQTIAGTKTFSTSPVIPTPDVSSNTTVPASTAYVNNKLLKVSTLPASPNSNVYYFIPE